MEVSGNAKAHFNFSRGTSSALNPASFADWNLVFAASPPQPAHAGPLLHAAPAGHGFAISSRLRSSVTAVPRKLAILWRSSGESGAACGFMTPPSSVL